MSTSVVIRLGVGGRTIHLPGLPPIPADSPDGKRVIRMVKDALRMRPTKRNR